MAQEKHEKNNDVFTRLRPWLFTAMLILAFATRFNNLPNIGLHYNSDEAVFLYEADWLNHNDNYARLYEPLGSLKPLYIEFLSWSLKLFGHYDYAAIFVSALLGSLSVLLLYLITSKLYGWKTGLAAGFFLALSRLHLVFSRNVMSDAAMSFFMLLTIWFYLLAREKKSWLWYLVTGILAGLAFQTKYLGIIMMLLLLVFELLARITYKESFSRIAKNYGVMLLGFMMVIAFTFLFFALIHKNYLYFLLGAFTQIDLGAKLVHALFPNIPRITGNVDFATGSTNLLFNYARYAYYFLFTTFWPLILAGIYFIASSIVSIARGSTKDSINRMTYGKTRRKFRKCDNLCSKERSDIFTLAWLVITVLIMLKIAYGVERVVLLLVPLFCLTAARGFMLFNMHAFKRIEFKYRVPKHWMALILLLAILAFNFAYSYHDFTDSDLTFRNASYYLKQDGAERIIVNEFNFIGFYAQKYTNDSAQIWNRDEFIKSMDSYTHLVIYSWKFTADMSEQNRFAKQIFDSCQEYKTIRQMLPEWKYPYELQKELNSCPCNKLLSDRLNSYMQQVPSQEQTLKIYRLDEQTKQCIRSLQ